MEIELSGPNLDSDIDEALFQRWKSIMSEPERKTYRALHDLINDEVGTIDSKMLARACGTSSNNLFKVILPRLRSLGLCEFGDDDD